MKRFFKILRIRYWDRLDRYRKWKEIFRKSGWNDRLAHQQAFRQSAWYDPDTGRSVEMILDLQGLLTNKERI
jgi:hypothetical protein